jgi:hypothetical protein
MAEPATAVAHAAKTVPMGAGLQTDRAPAGRVCGLRLVGIRALRQANERAQLGVLGADEPNPVSLRCYRPRGAPASASCSVRDREAKLVSAPAELQPIALEVGLSLLV